MIALHESGVPIISYRGHPSKHKKNLHLSQPKRKIQVKINILFNSDSVVFGRKQSFYLFIFYYYLIGKINTHLVGLELMTSVSISFLWEKEMPVEHWLVESEVELVEN
jgi:hypothetical protein